MDKTDDAIADYKRAVEVRQQMVDANPKDKDLAKALAKAKSDLEKIEPAAETPKDAAAGGDSQDSSSDSGTESAT